MTVEVRWTGASQRIRVDRTGDDDIVCIECFNEQDVISPSTSWGVSNGRTISPGGQQATDVGQNVAGVLVLERGVLGDGRDGEFGPILCISDTTIPDLRFYSSGE